MKLAIAYIRTECAAEVMRDLYEAGMGGITCYVVHGIRSEKPTFLYSTRPFEVHHLPAALKLEVICDEERIDEVISLIGRAARTGNRGDGIIAVHDLDRVIRIREIDPSPKTGA
jgi:nitrogen regulatory protein PII